MAFKSVQAKKELKLRRQERSVWSSFCPYVHSSVRGVSHTRPRNQTVLHTPSLSAPRLLSCHTSVVPTLHACGALAIPLISSPSLCSDGLAHYLVLQLCLLHPTCTLTLPTVVLYLPLLFPSPLSTHSPILLNLSSLLRPTPLLWLQPALQRPV